MTASELLPSVAPRDSTACASHLGAYYLPKTYLKVVIQRVTFRDPATKKITSEHHEVEKIVEVRKPDRVHGYCFDYRASPTAAEKIDVIRNKDFLLDYISTESIDESAYILRTLIRALFIGLSGNKDFTPYRTTTPIEKKHVVFEAEYDPFDQRQAAQINEALTAFQICLVLENHTFDPRQHTINSYCNNPRGVVKREAKHPSDAPQAQAGLKQARGIVYRPRLPYNLYAFTPERNGDGGGMAKAKGHHHPHRTWSLAATEIVYLENEAPSLIIGIERSFFAARKATIVFHEGALKDVCIHKTSELEQLTTVPLEIAGSIAALPANILQVRIVNTGNQKDLVAAERKLIQTQTEHIRFLSDPTNLSPTTTRPNRPEPMPKVQLSNGTVPGDLKTLQSAPGYASDICPNIVRKEPTAASPGTLPSFTE